MIEAEFEDAIEDILNECPECGHTTIGFHSTMCSNPDHRKLAQLLLIWPARVDEYERDDYEDQIKELESELHMIKCDLATEETEHEKTKERLKHWSILNSNTVVKK